MFLLFDFYLGSRVLLIIALTECLTISYLYGELSEYRSVGTAMAVHCDVTGFVVNRRTPLLRQPAHDAGLRHHSSDDDLLGDRHATLHLRASTCTHSPLISPLTFTSRLHVAGAPRSLLRLHQDAHVQQDLLVPGVVDRAGLVDRYVRCRYDSCCCSLQVRHG